MGQITFSDVVAKTESMKGVPADFGRRSLIKAGLAASILTLWGRALLGSGGSNVQRQETRRTPQHPDDG
jgi:hypothetical protein